MKAWKAELLLVLVTFIWGGTFTFTKIGLVDCPPSLYVIIRFTIALIISLTIFGRHFFGIDRKTLYRGLLLGFFFGSGFILQTYGLKFTTVPKSAFITGMAVVLTPFVFYFVQRKKIGIWQKIGIVVAFFGLWIFTDPSFDNINIGDLFTLCSTIFWALYITYMDVFTKGTSSIKLTSRLVIMQFVGATPLLLISFFLFEADNLYFNLSENLIISLAYNSIMASFLLTFIHTGVQKYSTPVKAALIFSLEPVIASTIAILYLNDIISGTELIGASVLLGGVLISEVGEFVFTKLKHFANSSQG